MEAVSKLFARGLLEIEIAVIKRMRSLGLPRDYIFGFIAQPGRVITPAAIGEVMSGKIGPEVEPASIATTRLFVSSRIASVRMPSSEEPDSPISPWRVEQALIWAQRGQDSLLPSEGYNTEFKLLFQPESEVQYIKPSLLSRTLGVDTSSLDCLMQESRFLFIQIAFLTSTGIRSTKN